MRAVWLIVVAACRFGFDDGLRREDAASTLDGDADTPSDGALDGAGDGVADSVALTCPTSYVALDARPSRYRLLTNSMTWLTAEQLCEGDGHHLVVFDDLAELMVVTAAIPGENIWTGVTDRKTIASFLKVTGGAATYLPWDSGEPDADALECVFVDAVTLALADQDCSSGRRGACECDGLAADPATY